MQNAKSGLGRVEQSPKGNRCGESFRLNPSDPTGKRTGKTRLEAKLVGGAFQREQSENAEKKEEDQNSSANHRQK